MVQSGNRNEAGLFIITYPVASLFLKFIMADLKSLCKEFKPDTNLGFDIRYADDTTIMSTVFEKLQLSTEELQVACRKWENQLLKMQGHHFIGEAYYSGRQRTRDCGRVLCIG